MRTTSSLGSSSCLKRLILASVGALAGRICIFGQPVWCGLTDNAIIGPCFFAEGNGQISAVNEERYGEQINEYSTRTVDGTNLMDPQIQQAGATCHTKRNNMSILRFRVPEQMVSRFEDTECPVRSLDLSPLDFFLWGYLKERVRFENPTTFIQLKDIIE